MLSFNMFTDFYYEYWGCGLFFILKHFIFKRMKVSVSKVNAILRLFLKCMLGWKRYTIV